MPPTYLYCYPRMRNNGCVRAAFTKSHNFQIVKREPKPKSTLLVLIKQFNLYVKIAFL